MTFSEIWAELGIEPTDDVRAVKRAYAKRLKADRPDKDPARFTALREAYEMALAYAESHAAGQEPTRSEPPVPQPAMRLPAVEVSTEMQPPVYVKPAFVPTVTPAPSNTERHTEAAPPDDGIRPLMRELKRALKAGSTADPTALALRILAHQALQRFSSREALEGEIVRLLARAPVAAAPIVNLFDREFRWSRDRAGLVRRFPADAKALIERLQVNAVTAEPDPEAERHRTRALQLLNARRLGCWLVLLFQPAARRAIADLLLNEDTSAIVTEQRKQWWLVRIQAFPPIAPALLALSVAAAMACFPLLLKIDIETPKLIVGVAGFTLAGPFLMWLVAILPWHYARHRHGPFATYWPAAAASMLVLARLSQFSGWAALLALCAGAAGMLFRAGRRHGQPGASRGRISAWAGRHHRALLAGLVTLILAAVTAGALRTAPVAWAVQPLLACLGYLVALSTARQFALNGVSGYVWFVASLILVIPYFSHAMEGGASVFYDIAILMLAVLWLSEEALRHDSELPGTALNIQVASALASLAALFAAALPLPLELRYVALIGALLAGEHIAPLASHQWMLRAGQPSEDDQEYDGPVGWPRLGTLMALGTAIWVAMNRSPASPVLPPPPSDGLYLILVSAVACRVLWTVFLYLPSGLRLLAAQRKAP